MRQDSRIIASYGTPKLNVPHRETASRNLLISKLRCFSSIRSSSTSVGGIRLLIEEGRLPARSRRSAHEPTRPVVVSVNRSDSIASVDSSGPRGEPPRALWDSCLIHAPQRLRLPLGATRVFLVNA